MMDIVLVPQDAAYGPYVVLSLQTVGAKVAASPFVITMAD